MPSKRYGRNQKRKHRAEIAELEKSLSYERQQKELARNELRYFDHQLSAFSALLPPKIRDRAGLEPIYTEQRIPITQPLSSFNQQDIELRHKLMFGFDLLSETNEFDRSLNLILHWFLPPNQQGRIGYRCTREVWEHRTPQLKREIAEALTMMLWTKPELKEDHP